MPVVKIDEKLGLKNETYRTMPILRSDGTTLYSTKDLALTRRKFEDRHIDRAIWVVDVRQSLYFEQIFKILELWGFEQAKNAHHLGYEMVILPEGVISSRKGNAPVYDDVRDAVLARAREIIDEKNPEMPGDEASEGRVAGRHRLAQVRDAGARQQQGGHIRHRGGALLRRPRGALYPVRACPGLPDPREREGAVGGSPSSTELQPEELSAAAVDRAAAGRGPAGGGGVPAVADRQLCLRSWPRPSATSTTPARCCRARNRCDRRDWRWSMRRGRRWPMGWRCWGSKRRSVM